MLGSPAGGCHWLGGPASHLWPSIQAGLPGHRAGERGSAGAMWTVIGGMWTLPDVFQYIGICVHESRDNMRFLLSLLFFFKHAVLIHHASLSSSWFSLLSLLSMPLPQEQSSGFLVADGIPQCGHVTVHLAVLSWQELKLLPP